MKAPLLLTIALVILAASCAKKTTATGISATGLTGTYWKLVELNGQPFTATGGKPAFISFQAEGRFSASAGCNSLMGGYETQNDFTLSFKPNMASTMMACPDQELENRFKDMLTNVNNYTIADNKLSLSKNRMAPLARFEKAVQPK